MNGLRRLVLPAAVAALLLLAGCADRGAEIPFDTVSLGLGAIRLRPPVGDLDTSLELAAVTNMLVARGDSGGGTLRFLTLFGPPPREGGGAVWNSALTEDKVIIAVFNYVATTFFAHDQPMQVRSVRRVGREVQVIVSQAEYDAAALRMQGGEYTHHVVAVPRDRVPDGQVTYVLLDQETGEELKRQLVVMYRPPEWLSDVPDFYYPCPTGTPCPAAEIIAPAYPPPAALAPESPAEPAATAPYPPPPTPPVPVLQDTSTALLITGAGRQGEPLILRYQTDASGAVVGDPARLDTSVWGPRDRLYGAWPSPRGRYVALDSIYGDAGHTVRVLDAATGTVGAPIPQAGFGHLDYVFGYTLAWHPDGKRLLVQGAKQTGTPGSTMLVDAESGKGDILALPDAHLASYAVTSASFAPGGQEFVVSYVEASKGLSEVWVSSLDGEHRLLYTAAGQRVEYVGWSPSGEWIALVRWSPGSDASEWEYTGELVLLRPESGEQTSLGSAAMSHYPADLLSPQWDPKGERLAFLVGNRLALEVELPVETNVHVWDAKTGEVTALTDDSGRLRTGLSWAPDGGELLFTERALGADAPAEVVAMSGTGRRRSPVPAGALDMARDLFLRTVWLVPEMGGAEP